MLPEYNAPPTERELAAEIQWKQLKLYSPNAHALGQCARKYIVCWYLAYGLKATIVQNKPDAEYLEIISAAFSWACAQNLGVELESCEYLLSFSDSIGEQLVLCFYLLQGLRNVWA